MPPPGGARDSQGPVEGGGTATSMPQGREPHAAVLLVAVAICGRPSGCPETVRRSLKNLADTLRSRNGSTMWRPLE
eukprot:scaffold53114_cov42-Prasinocladus_malaysianus.AAC.1